MGRRPRQAGYFTFAEANEAGHSSQLLTYYLEIGRVERWGRGIFRLVHLPTSDREDLVPVGLWSDREGVFGLETALSIHALSDTLAAHHDLIPPSHNRARQRSAPPGVRITFEDIANSEHEWHGPVRVTTVSPHAPRLHQPQALREAEARRLLTRAEARAIAKKEAA